MKQRFISGTPFHPSTYSRLAVLLVLKTCFAAVAMRPCESFASDLSPVGSDSKLDVAYANFLWTAQHTNEPRQHINHHLPFDSAIGDHYRVETDLLEQKQEGNSQVTLWNRIVQDHRHYYDAQSFRLITGGFLIGAGIANTRLDQEIQDHFQTSVRGATSDEWAEFLHANKELGDGWYTLPLFATAWGIGSYYDPSGVGHVAARWGERSIRSFLVGAPPLILAQRFTGGSRPGEKDRGSRWLPFQDNNGVSGHAFMASLPFLNAAKMTENRWLKTALVAGSLLGPLSRVNDNAHYPSQVTLGWWMSYVATSAVDRAEIASSDMQLYPFLTQDSYGAMLELRL